MAFLPGIRDVDGEGTDVGIFSFAHDADALADGNRFGTVVDFLAVAHRLETVVAVGEEEGVAIYTCLHRLFQFVGGKEAHGSLVVQEDVLVACWLARHVGSMKLTSRKLEAAELDAQQTGYHE